MRTKVVPLAVHGVGPPTRRRVRAEAAGDGRRVEGGDELGAGADLLVDAHVVRGRVADLAHLAGRPVLSDAGHLVGDVHGERRRPGGGRRTSGSTRSVPSGSRRSAPPTCPARRTRACPRARTASSASGIRLRRGTRSTPASAARRCSAARSGLPEPSRGRWSSRSTFSGVLKRAMPRPANQRLALLEVERCGGLDEGSDPLAHERVGIPHGHRVADVRMGLQRRLDLGGRDVLAAADDDVLEPPDDAHPAVVVERGQIPGAEPAAPCDDRTGLQRRRRSRRTSRGRAPRARPAPPSAQRDPVSGSETRNSTAPTACPSVSRAFSNGSSSVLVVTVGASVEP